MAASRLSTLAAVAATAAASLPAFSNRAYADGGSFRFSPFSSSPSPSPQPQPESASSDAKSAPPAADEQKGGFDPESLERGAKALREINSSPHAKQVVMCIYGYLFCGNFFPFVKYINKVTVLFAGI